MRDSLEEHVRKIQSKENDFGIESPYMFHIMESRDIVAAKIKEKG